jgi:hypothetical protein
MEEEMQLRVLTLALATALCASSAVALAQGSSTSSLSGTVLDEQGGAIPGATVTIKDNATGAMFTATTGAQGTFSVPALAIGTYTVTVTLDGFKTAVLNEVALNAGVPASVRAVLQVGGLQETVIVSSASSIVQTQSSEVSTTLNVTQIANLPTTSRSVLDFVVNLPGVNTPGGIRASTINGLPQGSINITLDGINVQDNTLKTTDGFFAIVSPRLDAVEEVTVSSAAQGADNAGQGSVQIRFITRSGSNTFSGSAYHYYRNDVLNANTWFNQRDGLPTPELLQNQPGVRAGGPVVIPGLFNGREKLFFFVNYEEFRQPSTVTRNRTILSPDAQAGIFRYNTSGGVREVNLLALAASRGQTSTFDPTIQKLLADIRASTGTTGAVSDLPDPNVQRFTWNVDRQSRNRYPTVRMDWNASNRHRVSGSLNYQRFLSIPDTLNNRDPRFPGFPATATQTSERIGFSSSLRSTFTSNIVNEFRFGGSGAPVQFFKELNPGMWGGTPVADQGGFMLELESFNDIDNASNNPTPSSRNASTWLVENTFNWLKGPHSFSFGGSWTQVDVWLRNQTLVPTLQFGVVDGDPAESLFTSANFPGSSSTNRGDAEDLYAVLVGRVSEINGNAGLDENTNEFVYLGPRLQRGRLRDVAFWAQDSWRVRPDLTMNYGLRYELQLPFYPVNDSYSNATLADAWGISGLASGCDHSNITPESCNLFRPGATPGQLPVYVPFTRGEHAYNIDLNNVAPSVGLAWTPTAEAGMFRRLIGHEGDTVLRAGFSRAFNRPGMSDFTGRFDDNPGILITADRTLSNGNLGQLPVLFRDRGRLGPPDFPTTRVYPMTDIDTGDVATFDRDIQIPYADSWTAGIQRAISRNMAVEVRYVGTRSRDLWTTYNLNEINIHENGFLNEFRLAQQNLQANLAAGRGGTFRYFGPGTGTSPLPIFLAYFSGVPLSQAGDASRYTSSNFASSTFVNPLAIHYPAPFTAANSLDSSASRRDNALRAGLPANFLVANPNRLGGAEVTSNGDYSNHNSVQFELRRRMANGLQFQTSYVFGRSYLSDFYSFRVPRLESLDTGTEGGVTHAFKANWVYELPFGRGRRFGSDAGPLLDRLIGGWQFHGTARLQSGVWVDFGNVRMVGFNRDDLRDMFKLRVDGNRLVWMLPQDIIDNTVKAFNVSATSPTGYSALGAPQGRYFAPASGADCVETIDSALGQCGTRVLEMRGPLFKNVDLSIAKLVPIVGRVRAEFRFEMLNAFNFTNFLPVTGEHEDIANDYSDPNRFEVTDLNGAVTSRIVQIVSRISW